MFPQIILASEWLMVLVLLCRFTQQDYYDFNGLSIMIHMACPPSGHDWYHYPGALSLSQESVMTHISSVQSTHGLCTL